MLVAPRMGAKRRAVLAVLLPAILALCLATASANAGTYVINDCAAAQPGNYTVGPWTQFGTILGPGTFRQTCASPTEPFGIAANLASDATAGEELQAPPTITIEHLKLWWEALAPVPGGGWTYALIDVYSPGWSRVYQAATSVAPNGLQAPPTELTLPTGTSKVNVEIYCTTSENCTFAQDPLQIYGSQITLSDSSLPTATITGGGLAQPGPLSGTENVSYSAEDSGSGVRAVEILIDGQPVAKNDYLSRCPYTSYAACPTVVSDLISWNTASASNGVHELALRVVNTAGNSAVIDDHPVTIDNQPIQASSSSLSGGVSGVANGNPCVGAELGVEVNARPGVPVTLYGDPVTVRGVLHCGTVPIRGAQIAVSTVGGGASAAINTSVQTGVDGSFSYAVPMGPNRRLQFAYTAYSNDPGPSVTAAATIAIRPSIKLAIGPRHTRNGHAIHWTGTIAGGPIPASGVTLDVEVQEGRRWRIFDQTVTGRTGRFHYSYRFHATTEPTTYKFRVALPDTGSVGYPYAAGASNTVNVHVTP
jgi:hypothetical protein